MPATTTPTRSGPPAPDGPPATLTVPDVAAWRAWLDTHEDDPDGVWLVLARKGVVDPTSLTYAEALDEALCSGWIDGQRRSGDASTFLQRFVPRRARSLWSQRNVEHVARLVAEGRMRERGRAEVERARTDGRWDRAYPGQATAEAPADLLAALDAVPGARARFDALGRQERFSVLHPLLTAPGDAVRAARLGRAVRALSAPGAGVAPEGGGADQAPAEVGAAPAQAGAAPAEGAAAPAPEGAGAGAADRDRS